MKTKEIKHFYLEYTEDDQDIITSISNLIDDTYEETVNKFNLKADAEKFEFILCASVKSFIEKTGRRVEDYETWMVGNADYIKRKICILSPKVVTDRSYDDMLAVIRHEIVHIAFDSLSNAEETNIMIAEGIAVALANQIDVTRINKEAYPNAWQLTDEDYFYENDGYLYSGVYVLYLIKKYGIDVFKRIYAGEESVEKYLYEGFEKEAIDYCL